MWKFCSNIRMQMRFIARDVISFSSKLIISLTSIALTSDSFVIYHKSFNNRGSRHFWKSVTFPITTDDFCLINANWIDTNYNTAPRKYCTSKGCFRYGSPCEGSTAFDRGRWFCSERTEVRCFVDRASSS